MTGHTNQGCWIIAEAGVNHNGDLEAARRLVNAARNAGADAVKFQTFRAESLVTRSVERAAYQKRNLGGRGGQYGMLKKLELSFDDFRRLRDYCEKMGIFFLSTPFDEDCARFLVEDLRMERIKISSGEVSNLPFLKYLAAWKKPLILSTGMSLYEEVERAVGAIRETWNQASLTVLHCTSNYPCPFNEVNLRAMVTLRDRLQLPVGYSDHTLGIEVAVAAVALGAAIIEKHFTLDRRMKGPDHKASILPDELKALVRSIRNIESALGSPEKKPTASELALRHIARKSLVLSKSLKAGARLSRKDLVARRSGGEIEPHQIDRLEGVRLKVNKEEGDPLSWADIARGNL